MSQSTPPDTSGADASGAGIEANLQIEGGAAILAPATAFQGGVPPGALILLPLKKPTDELIESMKAGPLVITPDQMWKLLGFNGPAVQIQDAQGRPITVGLEDLLTSLEKHWHENPDDLNRGRLYAQELMKYQRHEQAEKVMAKVVASGGTGQDWLGLGVAQLAVQKLDRAESTLKGAQNLMPDNPFPSLHLAKVYRAREDVAGELQLAEKAIAVDPNCVEAWAYLFARTRETEGDAPAEAAVTRLAEAEPNKKTAAPFVAVQGVYAAREETREQALTWAKRAVERNPDDVLALISLSALHGQRRDFQAIVDLLSRHEAKMVRDVRLANNYFEALFQGREMEKVTRLLNALAGSPDRTVKQFAVERSRAVAQYFQQQQQALNGVAANAAASSAPPRPRPQPGAAPRPR
jgi:tetratricopeptide (TPR) repeat protein